MEPELDKLYAAARARVGTTLAEAGGEADSVRVPSCPDWNVAQLAAHLAGTTVALTSGSFPKGDPQPWVDEHVAARSGQSALESWREWDHAGPAFEAMLVSNPGPLGSLLYDAIVHEDDINAALGRRPARDTAALRYALDRLFTRIDRDSRTHDVGSLVAVIDGDTYRAGDGAPLISVTVDDRREALRAFGSRRSARQLAAMPFDGDFTPWIAVLPHELPKDDLIEPS